MNNLEGWALTGIVIGGLITLWSLKIRRREKAKVAPLKAFAAENSAHLSHIDSWERSLIGIDYAKPGTLFYIRSMPDREIREKINLLEVSDCWVYNSTRLVNYRKQEVKVIDRIEVILTFYGRKPRKTLEFYNNDYDSLTLPGELQMAQKWNDVIHDMLSLNLKRSDAALKKETLGAGSPSPAIKPGVYPGKKNRQRAVTKDRAA